jgi:hypothetical protein
MKVLKTELVKKINSFIIAKQKLLADDDKQVILQKAQQENLKKMALAEAKLGKGEVEIRTGWKPGITVTYGFKIPKGFKEIETLGEWGRKEIEQKISAARNNLEMIAMSAGDSVPVTKSLKLDTYLSF